MTQATVTAKRWGSSIAVILPAALVRAEHIKEGSELVIDVQPADDWSDFFGAWKDDPVDAQAVKDEIRREEDEAHRRKWGVPL